MSKENFITINVVGGETVTLDKNNQLDYHAGLFNYAGVLSTMDEYKECDYYVDGMTLDDCDKLVQDKALELYC